MTRLAPISGALTTSEAPDTAAISGTVDVRAFVASMGGKNPLHTRVLLFLFDHGFTLEEVVRIKHDLTAHVRKSGLTEKAYLANVESVNTMKRPTRVALAKLCGMSEEGLRQWEKTHGTAKLRPINPQL